MEIKSKVVQQLDKYTNHSSLVKLAQRRGIELNGDTFSACAKIGYVEGYNAAMGDKNAKSIPVKNSNDNESLTNYIITDTYYDDDYPVKLTQSQIRLLDWLNDRNFLTDTFKYKEVHSQEFEEI